MKSLLKKQAQKLSAVFLTAALSISAITPVAALPALSDENILADPVQTAYAGRPEVSTMIQNLNFTDVPASNPSKESITRAGALGLVKGYDTTYQPSSPVSNEDAIAFALRIIGQEPNAQQTGTALMNNLPANSPLRDIWSLGYLNVAMQTGMITPAQYTQSITATPAPTVAPTPAPSPTPTVAPTPVPFYRTNPATREDVANWIYEAINSINPALLSTAQSQQSLYRFSDFDQIAADKAAAVEALARNNIIKPDASGRFRPKDSFTRAEMAEMVADLDLLYNQLWGFQKISGTVGAVLDSQFADTGSGQVNRVFYIRRADGLIDTLTYEINVSSSPQSPITDAVVYKGGQVTGLTALREGDQIEYIVNPTALPNPQVLYVNVLSQDLQVQTVQGILQGISFDPAGQASAITIADSTGKTFQYPLVQSMVVIDPNGVQSLVIGTTPVPIAQVPTGAAFSLQLKNNIVDRIEYVGQPTLTPDFRGIVLENNPSLGYMVVIDNSSKTVKMLYNENEISVQKQQYYDTAGYSYFSEMFPNFSYDPRDTNIASIEPGDIVFITPKKEDPTYLQSISAVTDYIMKYGQILQLQTNGDMNTMLIEYENGQQGWFDVSGEIFVSKDGLPIQYSDVKVGDWTRILVNQAIIEPGYIIESVKEMTIEGDEHYISNILKGKLANIDPIQGKMTMQNVYTLVGNNWADYQDIKQLSMNSRDTEYYYNGEQVSLDYVNHFLKRSQGDMYVALENNFAGEQVRKVTFRNDRDSLLSPSTVVTANGSNSFGMAGQMRLATDNGTIVRRFGRLVDGTSIQPQDYALVSLNGQGTAAIVDIADAPDTSGITFAYGPILSVDEGKSFKVQDMDVFSNTGWNPVFYPREFTIDYDTVFINADGVVDRDTFIDYTADSVYGKMYYFITDGTRATMVIDAPYIPNSPNNQNLRGTVVSVADGDGVGILLKDATYSGSSTNQIYKPVGTADSSATLTVAPNTIIIKNNEVVQPSALVPGDQVKAWLPSGSIPDRVTGGMTFNTYILQVEK